MKFAFDFDTLFFSANFGHWYNDHKCQKNWKVLAVEKFYNPLTGSHIQDMCEVKLEPINMGIFWGRFFREIHVTSVEALYVQLGIVDNSCFFEFMNEAWMQAQVVIYKAKNCYPILYLRGMANCWTRFSRHAHEKH